MPELDHLIYASADLAAGVDAIRDLTGTEPVPGGPHPGVGTRNHLLTFDDVTYFEVIGVDPDQREPVRRRPFGLDDNGSPRLAGFAIHPSGDETIEELAAMLAGAGHDPGPVQSMSRVRPDGVEINWRLTLADDGTGQGDGCVPFAIDWGTTPSPAVSLPTMGSLVRLRVSHPDESVRALVDGLGLGITVLEGAPGLVAEVDTAGAGGRGVVELR